MSPVHLGTIIFFSFFSLLIFRPLLQKGVVARASEEIQPRLAFSLDFCLCLTAGVLINTYNGIIHHIPLPNLLSLFVGCLIGGFFIGLDSALRQERVVIVATTAQSVSTGLPDRFFPMTRRFTFVAITASVFVALVLILVFTRDVEWLVTAHYSEDTLHEAQMSVIYEVLFIIAVLMALIVNLIFSYSRNLSLLFKNETRVLEQVQKGNLSDKVPVATSDEFGVIAGHTNHMIDGLRHRFELISSLKLAEEVQQNLLPEASPSIEGYDISGTSIYCEQTGGDYYDYFQLPHDRLGVAVADACGHGVGAALLMSSVRAFIASAVSQYSSPSSLMNAINSFITRDCSKTSRFTSMFFLELDRVSNTIRWVRAGHEPALHYCGNKDEFVTLHGPGVVLGIDLDYQYENNSTTSLQGGDILLIGTDGIRECRNREGVLFGVDRIKELIQKTAHESAQQIQTAIVSEVSTFRGSLPQEDDITLVVIKFL